MNTEGIGNLKTGMEDLRAGLERFNVKGVQVLGEDRSSIPQVIVGADGAEGLFRAVHFFNLHAGEKKWTIEIGSEEETFILIPENSSEISLKQFEVEVKELGGFLQTFLKNVCRETFL